MAELKTREVNDTSEKKTEKERKVTPAKDKGNAKGKRVGAVILWLFAIAFEALAILILFGRINVTPTQDTALYFAIGALVLDLICVIIGSQLWKNANHIDPASKKKKVKFFLWNNMGLIVSVFAFLPFILLIVKDKDKFDKKTKAIALVVGVIALLIGGLTSYDWNPVSQESKAEAINEITDNVYWTRYGTVYHVDVNCSHISTKDYYEGTVEEAIDNNRTRLCKDCAKKYNIEIEATED